MERLLMRGRCPWVFFLAMAPFLLDGKPAFSVDPQSLWNFALHWQETQHKPQDLIDLLNGVAPPSTPTPSVTLTETPTPTGTATETDIPTPSVTASPTEIVTLSLTPSTTDTPTPTPSVTLTPTPTQTHTPTDSPTATNSPTPTATIPRDQAYDYSLIFRDSLTVLTVEDESYPKVNLDPPGLDIVWDTGSIAGLETAVRVTRLLGNVAGCATLTLDIKPSGLGGSLYIYLNERDGDIWALEDPSVLAEDHRVSRDYSVSAFSIPAWYTSPGDMTLDLATITHVDLDLVAYQSQNLGVHNIKIYSLACVGSATPEFSFSDPSLIRLRNLYSGGTISAPYVSQPCAIHVSASSIRDLYLAQTIFLPSRLTTSTTLELATPADVNVDNTRFGYATSTKPPAYVPLIQYATETPTYPFVGQMVPGTDIHYATPEIDPVWLVDIVNTGTQEIVVPAFTTIDFHTFRSINWPRVRYLGAILAAKAGLVDATLSGSELTGDKTISGIIHVTGDYAHGEARNATFTVNPNTVFVMAANHSDFNHPWGTGDVYANNRINLIFGGMRFRSIGTPQHPIIWTSDSNNPIGNDWDRIASSLADVDMRFNLIEYARTGTITFNDTSNNNCDHNIVRYTERNLGPGAIWSVGISTLDMGSTIERSEIHNTSVGVAVDSYGDHLTVVRDNVVYNNNIISDGPGGTNGGTKGIGASGERHVLTENNVVAKCRGNGLTPEDNTAPSVIFRKNVVCANMTGVSLYYDEPGEFSNPTIENNNVWHNVLPWWGPVGAVVNYIEGSSTVGGPWLVDNKYGPLNESHDPLFRNIKIYDLAHDTDGDGVFSDIEVQQGRDPWVAE
jgi:hypothetical protein